MPNHALSTATLALLATTVTGPGTVSATGESGPTALARAPALRTAAPGQEAVPGPAGEGREDAAADLAERLQEALRNRVEAAAGRDGRLDVGPERIRAFGSLSGFYEQRGYRPAWTGARGPRDAVRVLTASLEDARGDGLEPADYHLPEIRRLLERTPGHPTGAAPSAGYHEIGHLVDLELLLTDGFLLLASHLDSGHLDPASLHPDWVARPRGTDPAAILGAALASDAPGAVGDALDSLRPPLPGYRRLRETLAGHRAVAATGGWTVVPEGGTLRPGDDGERIPALRSRLAASGDLASPGPAAAVDSLLFDEALADAVRTFQARHGLEPDAVVGPATLDALNVPASRRADQIAVNLERWRWLPRDLGERHVLVNAASYELELVEGEDTVLTTRAVVGRPYRRTPAFSDRITYLVFSPYWHVPHNLAVQDQLPLQRQDPGYFDRVGMRVFRGWGADAREIPTSDVDWSEVGADTFPYRLRQDPGPHNALGGVKFMFPNPFSVYLHDTPSRELFARRTRTFSSGCIRVERARELAVELLRGADGWGPERVRTALGRGEEETVPLPEPVPVHLLYWTAWVEPDGRVHFRPDVYGRDGPVQEGLERRPPGPGAGEAGS